MSEISILPYLNPLSTDTIWERGDLSKKNQMSGLVIAQNVTPSFKYKRFAMKTKNVDMIPCCSKRQAVKQKRKPVSLLGVVFFSRGFSGFFGLKRKEKKKK